MGPNEFIFKSDFVMNCNGLPLTFIVKDAEIGDIIYLPSKIDISFKYERECDYTSASRTMIVKHDGSVEYNQFKDSQVPPSMYG